MDRQSLLDGDDTATREADDVFGDEFEAEDFDVVADGFRPRSSREESGSSRQASDHHDPIHTISAQSPPGPLSYTSPAAMPRSSITKSHGTQNPFMDAEERDDGDDDDDDEMSPLDPRPVLHFEPHGHRTRPSISSDTSGIFPHATSPRFGSAGPSHPYGMYPQGTVARSPSLATTITMRPQRQSSIRHGPSHPYTMYPQGVDEDLEDEDDDDDDDLQQNPVQVGFPGLGSTYTRRVGPDGEEQDIIGDYGHAEQLPPYTRYPDEMPEKMPLLPVALHSRAPVAGTDPTMPLMHDTLQPTPAPASMTDESNLNRVSSRLSLAPSHASAPLTQSTTNTDLKSWQSKKWNEKTWKEKRKTRFCGIPFWWILLSFCVTTFIVAVLGGVIGSFMTHRHHINDFTEVYVVTSLLDASIIASPSSGAPSTGTYALSMSTPQTTQAMCLPEASQQAAWNCDLVPNQALGIIVGPNSNLTGSGANIFYAGQDERIFYGAQVWTMNTAWAEFLTVQDNDAPEDGPAFYFSQFFDKIVVVPESDFNASTKKMKRQAPFWPHHWGTQMQAANMPQPGDKPWFCVWNNTLLEGFIYVDKSAATSAVTTTSSSWASSTSSASSASITPAPTSSTAGSGGADSFVTTMTSTSTTGTYSVNSAGFMASSSSLNADQAYTTGAASQNKRQASSATWGSMEQYPLLVKLEERRVPDNPIPAYCQQYQILWDLSANWVPGANGDPIYVELDESDPSYSAYQSAGIAGDSRSAKRTSNPGGCVCQWMAGET